MSSLLSLYPQARCPFQTVMSEANEPGELCRVSTRHTHSATHFSKMTMLIVDPQSYLLSIRPFLRPAPSAKTRAEKGPVPTDDHESTSLVSGAEEESVFHWGRDVEVDWSQVAWVTFRDQVRVLLPISVSNPKPTAYSDYCR